MFYLMFLLVILLILIFYYIIRSFQKISFLSKIKSKLLKLIISIVPFIVIFIFFNYVNSLIIIIHLAIFLLISSFILFVIKKIIGKEFNYSYKILLGIILTLIYLIYGAYSDYHVYNTYYEIETDKEIGSNFRIIQISDSHIGATFDGNGLIKHMENIKDIESDIVVITGDFVDDDTTREDMIKGVSALTILKPKYGIYFINGNHDKGYFNYRNFTYNELKNELEKNNINVLEDECIMINDYFYLIGRNDKSDLNRKSINELVENIDKTKYIIDLNHQPNDYENEKNKVDLVLSGHTHGGQLFPLGYLGVLMGANDEFYGLHKRDNTYFIVNSGISDWAIDFKTGTFSEIGIIDIKKS